MLFGEAPNGWLAAQQSRFSPGMRVVCPADGDARNGVWLASLGVHAIGFDLSEVGVEHAVRHARSRGLKVRAAPSDSLARLPGLRAILDAPSGGSLAICCADLAEWPWSETPADAIAAIFFQFASPELRLAAFNGFAQALRPGGLLIIEGYGLRQLQYKTGGPGVAENLYTLDMFREAFPHWEVLASRDCDADLAEGSSHVGRSHLISAVLRKPD
jgi:SAM-dependent methyltransferase